jgi:two-component system sensor histidine kinase PhoQ
MELVGNVLDNAFKYGRSRVRVTASSQSGGAGDRAGLRLAIEDDGPGIPEDKVEYVLQRGARADTLLQGQGIGLAVVTDIVSSYKGTVRVGRSELGGVLIEMLFNTPTLSGGN